MRSFTFITAGFLFIASTAFAEENTFCTVSSDPSVVTADFIDNNVTPQTAMIRVDRLATNEVWNAEFSSADDSVTSTDQFFTITYRGISTPLYIVAGTTLTQFAKIISFDNSSVTTTIYDTGSGNSKPMRLSITDRQSGKANPNQTPGINFNISFTSKLTNLPTAAFGTVPVIEGSDSKIYLNKNSSDPIYRDTNFIADLIPNLLVRLNSMSSEWTQISVQQSCKSVCK